MLKRKKLVALVMCATVGTQLFMGCGKTNNEYSSKDYGLSDISFPIDEDVTLKFMTQSSPLAPNDPNEKLVYKRLQEATGVKIDWINYTNDVYAEKRNLDIAAGDLPDAIMHAGLGDYDLLKLAKDGAIIPVEDLIDEYMPNLKAILDENPEYRTLSTAEDGHIYSFPWIEELGQGKESIQSVDNIPWINVEWLNNLGLEMPTTTEELKEVLIAFKTQDPNGNGKQDEIPMSFIINDGGQDPGSLFAAFGLGDNWDHTVVSNDGEVILTASQEGYKDALSYFSDLYKEGLIDLEAFEQDYNTYLSKAKDDKYGLYFTWDKANFTGNNDKYDAMPVLEGPDGTKNMARTNGMGFERGRFVITTANENLELTAKWVDKLYEPIQSVQNNWGTYGDTTQGNVFEYDEENNMLKHLELTEAPAEIRQKTEVGGPLAILNSYYGEITTMPDDAAWRLDILKEKYVPYMSAENIYPKVFFSLEDSDRLSKIEGDLMPYIQRMKAEFMINGVTDSGWNSYLAELDRLGVKEWLEIKQKGYDNTASK